EVVHADLLLHVIDVSEPDHEAQTRVVRDVLADLDAADTPALLVFNKFDRIPPAERVGVRVRILADHPEAVMASAVDPRGLAALVEALARFVRHGEVRVRVTLPLAASRSLARLYEVGEVLGREYTEDAVVVDLRARPDVVERLKQEGLAVRVAS
ncbi:MAG TPA: GTPase HflX, partial [Gemmatimonadota bacterium]|nr:GTPase HflX [Gemmatimonadota bacterium]